MTIDQSPSIRPADRDAAIHDLTEVMSKFTSWIGKRLPTDVTQRLGQLREQEVNFLAKEVYESMRQNQQAADELDRPSCQDTGVIQYFLTAGAKFPLLGELEDILRNATLGATRDGPLRHNAVETFDEK
ncbi:MAG: L(+)-tartrate dehydratase alpha subunit, partial [Pseudomonadota bacterium]|nr:L(+)-tartrate dehydratase alpha subunit [Pseudomonadota bacterium]